ncbi:DUF2062 domain-containing protein [Kangiella taiwanensis]|uniref:DUF2062 domain-containing protein n=1 Tax=Kangiella taiwanensis TaxID=1079179 RepID=A0ABP8I888_9GAMM|nr:DUF2062 domain-containing protein [Kangiella taiwanensis]
MPRKLLRKITPDPKKVTENRFLKIFGKLIHDPGLWHLNRYSASGAFAVGLFMCFMPIPFQMVMAAGLAIWFRVNLPLSVLLCWITNPITIPPMFYFAYLVGTWVLSWPPSQFEFELSFEWLGNELIHIWQPFLLGCLICGSIAAIIGYYTISLSWRYHVVMAWKARQQKWKEKLMHTLHLDGDDEGENKKAQDKPEPSDKK